MKVIIIILTLFISSCSLFQKPIVSIPKFPPAVEELTISCPDLEEIKGDSVLISDLLKAVVNNYTLYYKCSLKNEGWNTWYKEQRQIWEAKQNEK